MGRKDSLGARFRLNNTPVKLEVETTLHTMLTLQGLGEQMGLSVEEIVSDAIGWWKVRRETSLNRRGRLRVENALREAKDSRPAQEIIDDFLRQMKANAVGGDHLSDGCCTTLGMAQSDDSQQLRARREALGLSQKKLAELSRLSVSYIVQLERGLTPKASPKLEQLEATLSEQERISA